MSINDLGTLPPRLLKPGYERFLSTFGPEESAAKILATGEVASEFENLNQLP